jgi:fermentation-respiration switch protein FrsA (DUF1100 family)
MKNIGLFVVVTLVTLLVNGQDITGQWNGILKVQGIQLRLVFHISKADNGYSATMDSPDQGAKGIPATTTTFSYPTLKIEVANAGINYSGELKGSEILGTFKQGSLELPLNLSRNEVQKEIAKKPQEPTKPYPYYTEEVTFQNTKANISLSGTLSLPKKEGTYPVVVLISGSGPQNRDEELLGHKPFLVIADYLTRNGIGVLRYDDRGVGKSTGEFQTATSADFATDVESAIAYLKTRSEVSTKKIGLIGHSEGGLIAPMVAAGSKDVNYIILMAGTGLRGDKLLLLQQELIAKASGVPAEQIKKTVATNAKLFERVIKAGDEQTLKSDLANLINESMKEDSSTSLPKGMTKEAYVSAQVGQITSPWIQYFLKHDPANVLEKVKCPVLAINGEKDLQVPAKENLSAIEKALKKGGNKKVTIKQFPNLNHLFQESKTGLPNEYAQIEQTFSPAVLDEMTRWIVDQTK